MVARSVEWLVPLLHRHAERELACRTYASLFTSTILGDFVGGEGEPSCTKGRKTICSCGVLKHVFDQERGSAQKLRDQRKMCSNKPA